MDMLVTTPKLAPRDHAHGLHTVVSFIRCLRVDIEGVLHLHAALYTAVA